MDTLPSEPINLIYLPLWLARLGTDASVLDRFRANPLIFASWYSVVGSWVDWSEQPAALIEAERSKKLSFDRATALLRKVNYTLAESNDVAHARRILEGYALHDWALQNTDTLQALARASVQRMESLSGVWSRTSKTRVEELAQVLQLNPTEEKVLTLAVLCSVSPELRSILEQLLQHRRSNVAKLWETMLGCSSTELAQALSSHAMLRKSRLLQAHGNGQTFPVVSSFWVDVLMNPMESLFERLLKPLEVKNGAGMPARLCEEDFGLACEVLINAKEPGINLLLYGADGLEKRSMLAEVLNRSGKQGYVLETLEDAWKDLPTAAFVAQRFLFERMGLNAVLVIERPSDVLERKPNEFFRMMLGLEVDSSHITPFDELLLASNPAPTLWAGPGADRLPEECVARFIFHAQLKKARRQERRAQLERFVQELKLSKATREELLQLEDISALQLQTALRAAKLAGATTKKEREAHLVRAVKRSLQALNRDTTTKGKDCVTEYSLKYVNHAGRFGPMQIMKALQLRPKGSLCLYGPPGTGKTQFVEYLAQQLGQRLLVKQASDLMSKYVGETEKNIAAMFAEAENEEAVLFLDEGDSFLRNRAVAQTGWEVTRVNELLQHMERFAGTFIMATNLFKGLDVAALRRFTFKLEFRELSSDQRWEMFLNESGLKGHLSEYSRAVREQWMEDLCLMRMLTAGDFATVKRQCLLLGESLTPAQWVEQLELECLVKEDAKRNEGLHLA